MAKTPPQFIVLSSMLDNHLQGTILTDRDLRGQSERLVKNGAIREATAAEIAAHEAALAGDATPMTAGAPVGYPNPNDDPDGSIAAATRQAELDALEAMHAADRSAWEAERTQLQQRIDTLTAENKKLKKQEPAS